MLVSILILKAIGSTQKSKMFPSQSSLQAFKLYFRHDLFPANDRYHQFISLICLMYLSLPNPYFYAIRSIKIFLKVLNKVNSECLNKPRLFLTIELLPSAKLLELSAINHGLSERRIIFFLVVEVLPPVFWLFYNLHRCALPRS